MRISSAFPSNYLRADDLQERTVRVKIQNVQMEDIGSDHKPVLYFEGKDKGMVLNKTNANNIAQAYGDDTDGWGGGIVELYPTMVDFQGRSVPAIRVRVPPRSAQPAQQQREPNPPAQDSVALSDALDDEIPFEMCWK